MNETDSKDEMARVYRAVYAEALGLKIRKGLAERASRGMPNYRPPLGYGLAWTGRDQKVEVDEGAAPYVREAFRMAASGVSPGEILAELTARGMRTVRGREMSPPALRKILRNLYYLGYIQHRQESRTGMHESLVEPSNFHQAQKAICIQIRNPKSCT